MRVLLISRWSALCHIKYLVLIFPFISIFQNVNCFISSSTTTSPLLIVPSPSMFIKINHSDAIKSSPNRTAASWNSFFVKQEAWSTTRTPSPSSQPPSSSLSSFELYNNAPIRSRAVEHLQPYRVHYIMKQKKNYSKDVEPISNSTELQDKQQINKSTHFETVHQPLNKVQIVTEPVEPMKTLSQLPEQSEELGLSDLLQTEESSHNEKLANTPSDYFINIPSQPIPIQIRFNTQTSTIKTEQNHISNPGVVKKLFTVEQPDRLIHMVSSQIHTNAVNFNFNFSLIDQQTIGT